MKAYMSYWRGGWQLEPSLFVINCHRLAGFLAKKHFKEVHFLTDRESLKYFKDIPFDSIECIFDDLDLRYNDVWSVSKLLAYEHICKKQEPFVHIDYDVFLWAGIPERLLKAEVFAQCEESNSYDWYGIKTFLENCPVCYLIEEIDPKPRHGINVGIFGGNNINFIEKYTKSSLSIIFDKRNEDFFFNKKIFKQYWNKAVIVEQYTLAVCCQYYNTKCEFYFPEGWPNDIKASSKYYTHLMSSKNNLVLKNKILNSTEKLNNLLLKLNR